MENSTKTWLGIGTVVAAIGILFYFKSDKSKTATAPKAGGLTPDATAAGVNRALSANIPLSVNMKEAMAFLKKKGYVLVNNQMVKA